MSKNIVSILLGVIIFIVALVILAKVAKKLKCAKTFVKVACAGLLTAAIVFGAIVIGGNLFDMGIFGAFINPSDGAENNGAENNDGNGSENGGGNPNDENYVPGHTHVFEKTAWEHKYICGCEYDGFTEAHSGGTATCQEYPRCDVCGSTHSGREDCRQGTDGNCIWCGQPVNISSKLIFEINESGTGYILKDGKQCGSGTVRIPAYYMGLPVVEIGTNAFYQTKITGVFIPKTVKTIANRAFVNCGYLLGVEFQKDSSLEVIGDAAFKSTGLTGITIPKTVRVLEKDAFGGCIDLDYVTFEEGSVLESIGRIVFSYCNDITEFRIPSSVRTIGKSALHGCSALENLYFEGSIADWSSMAFIDEYDQEMSHSEWAKTFRLSVVHCADGDYYFE